MAAVKSTATNDATEAQQSEAQTAEGSHDSPRLGRLLRQFRQPNNTANIWYVGVDLLTLTGLICTGVLILERCRSGELSLYFTAPVVAIIVVLIGAVQHRLAGLGHEGSHHMLFRHRLTNELVADWLCMFPLFTTTDHYRSLHLGHHRWVNDRERDPEFQNLGRTRKLHTFPMSRWQFVTHFVSRILWPVSLLRYTWDNALHGSIGITEKNAEDWKPVRWLFAAGVTHFLVTTFCLRAFASTTLQALLIVGTSSALAGVAIACIPERHFYRSGYPGGYGPKLRSWMRLTFFALLQLCVTIGTLRTGNDWTLYLRLFWVLPLLTGFPYFMLLRDAYQHANTDEGRYTNSRVMFPDAFSRWSIFMYGSDIHLTHHLHPGVPHYKLRRLHDVLKRRSKQYADEVVETYGTFRRSKPGFPCLVETIETARD